VGLRQSVGALSEALLSAACARIELFALEAADQKARVVQLLALLAAALFFAALAVLVLSVTIALYFWPTPYRFLALWLMVLAYLILGVAAFWLLRRQLRGGGVPFAATLEELRRDVALVSRLRDDTADSTPPRSK
jgi:uncharacterized membrane protein YqjE